MERAVKETYTFKVAPTYTCANFCRGMTFIELHEWAGRTVEDFARGMANRGFSYRKEEYDLSTGHFIEHVWEK
jgi:hypothetical protein